MKATYEKCCQIEDQPPCASEPCTQAAINRCSECGRAWCVSHTPWPFEVEEVNELGGYTGRCGECEGVRPPQ